MNGFMNYVLNEGTFSKVNQKHILNIIESNLDTFKKKAKIGLDKYCNDIGKINDPSDIIRGCDKEIDVLSQQFIDSMKSYLTQEFSKKGEI